MKAVTRLSCLAMLFATCLADTNGIETQFEGSSPVGWSEKLALSEMKRLGNSLEWGSPGSRSKWDYASSVLALSLVRLGEFTGNPAFTEFGIRAVASHVDPDGTIRGFKPEDCNIDGIAPGNVLLAGIERGVTDASWRKALDTLRAQMERQPRTDDGGFWHKKRYPSQMWLDGLYMASPFLARYAATYGVPSLFDEVCRQIILMDRHAYDPATGLHRHAWDEKHAQPWADPETGCSPNVWSRSIGWYAMAIVDVLDVLPRDHPRRAELLEIFGRLAEGIVRWRDPASGVWWQVTNEGTKDGNYLEASGSSMFVYALAKGVNKGYLPREKYLPHVFGGYRGILGTFVKSGNDGSVNLTRICEVAGLGSTNAAGRPRDGSFGYYVSEPVVENDPKGTGPFIMAGIELQRLLNEQTRRPGIPVPKAPKFVLVGDSTVTDKLGWGAGFRRFCTGGASVVNAAANGRSSKSYRAEGRWGSALAEEGDYYLIQFGHNDQPGKGPDRETDPSTTYAENMARYVDEVRSAGAKPVLVTSLTRRDFEKSGNGKIASSLTPYVESVRKIAAVKNVPLVDLNALSTAYCETIGAGESAAFNPPSPGKDGKPDTTHLNDAGSLRFGGMVAGELRRVLPELAPFLRTEPAESGSPPDAPSDAPRVVRDVVYSNAGEDPLLLDVHVPAGKGPFPVVLFIHGGGWSAGDKGGSDKPGNGADISPLFGALDAAPFTWFSMNYRLAPAHRWPACFEDVQSAIVWVKAHASEYKGDPGRVALLGHSAGGHLAVLAGTLPSESTRVQAVVGVAPVTNHEQDLPQRGGVSASLQKLLDRPKEPTAESLALLREISPIRHVCPGLPPFLLVHGEQDKTVPIRQSQDFQEALSAAGVSCDLMPISGGAHALADLARKDPSYPDRMVSWLKEKLSPRQSSSPADPMKQSPWVADLGDGTYRNPVLYADYSDPDAIRVGEDYWLTSSSFTHVPGLPILHSKDLVNWELVGHALPRLSPGETYAVPRHGNGVWAPSIRHHDGKYRIYYPDPDFGIFVITASDPRGPWSDPVLVKEGKGLIDPCPLWDDDGKVYLIHGWAKSRAGFNNVLTMLCLDSSGTSVERDLGIVINGNDIPGFTTLEGPKLYKRNGWYYVFAPAGGVPVGWQSVFRSRNITGPYEQRIVMDRGKTTVNGPHQGALVDTPSGESWFLHFQDQDAYGRVVHLQPVEWRDDWPVIGEDQGNGKGQPVLIHRKPFLPVQPIASPPSGDEFQAKETGLQWQWQANPREEWFSLVEKPGSLRLKAICRPSSNLWEAPYLFLQKFPAPLFSATVQIALVSEKPGDRAGLIVFGSDYAWIGIRRNPDGFEIVQSLCKDAVKGGAEKMNPGIPIPSGTAFLRVTVREGGRCRFSYSLDGNTYTELGPEFNSRPGRWVGAKVGLFCDSEAEGSKGCADVSWFRISGP